ncbi:MAG: putative DNA binding domain-containing protein [Nitrospira sp.]|nr:putative DNA binding domain-containing protein [Nitrospira sp.]
MPIPVRALTQAERDKLLSFQEGHFGDLKGARITPSKLTNTIAALSNAEGGELYLGIEQDLTIGTVSWKGFNDQEAANAHIQVFEELFPLGDGYTYTFLTSPLDPGLVLKIDIAKSRDIKKASDGVVYLRRGAQNLRVTTEEALTRLRRNKGLVSFETDTVNADPRTITNSATTIGFMLEVVPTSEPESWLHKQQLLINGKPTVAGLVLFAEEPQAILPKRTGIKLYRYQTTAEEGTRETLLTDPISIEGDAYAQIREAVAKTAEIIESVRVNTPDGLEQVRYPITALHEIITNAVLHRDYSIADDIHIRIFDNRVEVISPGTFPAHITPENILHERFARNATIVRLINKFPNPPNKDVGEGLNTAFRAMREMKLKPPIVTQTGASVKVVLRHEPLATPEELILQHLQKNEQITNKVARELCFIGSENKMKGILQRMVKNGIIELVPGTTRYSAAYRLVRPKKK